MNESEIRNTWLNSWRDAAKKDGGAWLASIFGAAKDDAEQLTEDMLTAISEIPIEEPDDEDNGFDVNFVLHWQRYGIDVEDDELATLYFEGKRRAAIFAQVDAISELPLKAFLDTTSAKSIVIELPPNSRNHDEMKNAIEFFEDGLGLEADLLEDGSRLPWNGDDTRVALDLNDSWTLEALEDALSETEDY